MRALLFISLLALGGCKQGAGQPCQVQADCDDGLTCQLPPGGNLQSGGVCVPNNADLGVDGGSADLSTQDLATAD